MKYYFVQHGKAVSKDIDEARPLSDDGINETLAIAKKLRINNVTISQICHSGKKRAAQTAEIIAAELGISSVNEIKGMAPNDGVKSFSESQLVSDGGNTLYVGHLPHLGKLVSYLLTNDDSINCVTFQNSAVVCIDSTDNGASILWLMTPTTI